MANKTLTYLGKYIGLFGFIYTIFISINSIIGYILIYFIGLTYQNAAIVVMASTVTLLILLFKFYKILIYYDVIKRILLPILIPIFISALVSFLISLNIYRNTYNIWDESNILSVAFYILTQGTLPHRTPASMDLGFYPLGSSIILSTYTALALGKASFIHTYNVNAILKYILPETLQKLAIVNAIFIFFTIFSIITILIGITFNFLSELDEICKTDYNWYSYNILFLVFSTSLLVITGIGYILVYPVNSNAYVGTLMFLSLIYFISYYNDYNNKSSYNLKFLIMIIMISLSVLLFHYTFFTLIISFLLFLVIFDFLDNYRKNKFYRYLKQISIISIIIIILNIFINKDLINPDISNPYLQTWNYLQLKRISYLEIEPGIFGKFIDINIYIKYKILRYINYLFNNFLFETKYIGIIFFIFAGIGFYIFIKYIIAYYKNSILFILLYSILFILSLPLLFFTRLFVPIQIIITILSVLGLYVYVTCFKAKKRKAALKSNNLQIFKITRMLDITIVLLLIISNFMYLYYHPTYSTTQLLNTDNIYQLSCVINKINNGRALLPASPETTILWAIYPDKILGSDPRHIMIKTRIYTSIIFDKYYTAIGPYDFTGIPLNFKKEIIDKYHIVLIIQKQNVLFSDKTALNLGFKYIGSINDYRVWASAQINKNEDILKSLIVDCHK